MNKKIIKVILSINNTWLRIITILSVIIGCISFTPKVINSLEKIYPQLNNDTLKNGVSLVTDLDIFNKEFKWLSYVNIAIFVLCLISIYVKWKYKNKEIIDKVIVGHSSMSEVAFNVDTDGEFQVKEINLIDDMKDTTSDYDKIKYAINKQDGLVSEFKRNIDNNYEYGYMGIAHTPLILRMGNQIGDEIGVKLFHKSRTEGKNTNVFKELNKDENFKELMISTKILDKNSDELIVGLSTTFEIKYDELKVFNPDDKNILIFSSEDLGFDVIESTNQVKHYVKYIMDNVRKVVKDKNINKIHMVLSTSSVMTFALGQAISLNNDPNITIYHYDINNPRKYTWGIDLSKNYRDCLVVTNEPCNFMV